MGHILFLKKLLNMFILEYSEYVHTRLRLAQLFLMKIYLF